MPIITVCKGCGNVMQAVDSAGKPACVICLGTSKDNSIPVQMEISSQIYCTYNCGSYAEWDDTKKVWMVSLSGKGGWNQTYHFKYRRGEVKGDLPFMNAKDGKFYCGCMGWD